jgi:hypothetical protein
MRHITLSDNRTMAVGLYFFSAIEPAEYRRIQETIGLSDIGSRPQSIGLSDIGLKKNYRFSTSAPGRPSASLLCRPCVPVDHRRQVNHADGSCPSKQHGGQHVHGRLHQPWASSTCSPQLTTLKAMRWLSACTGQIKDALCSHGASPTWHSHTPGPVIARAGSSTCRRAAAAHMASILCSGHQHAAGSFSQGESCVCASWRPAEASGGPM